MLKYWIIAEASDSDQTEHSFCIERCFFSPVILYIDDKCVMQTDSSQTERHAWVCESQGRSGTWTVSDMEKWDWAVPFKKTCMQSLLVRVCVCLRINACKIDLTGLNWAVASLWWQLHVLKRNIYWETLIQMPPGPSPLHSHQIHTQNTWSKM